MDEDDLRSCFRYEIIIQMANAHHKRYTPGVKPHRPYLPPHIRTTGKLDGVCELCAAIASLVSPVVKKIVCEIR